MGKRFGAITFAATILIMSGNAYAQCTREGEEQCKNGQTYRCEKTGNELTPIFQNVPCGASAAGLNGVWAGNGHQSPAGDAGEDWPITLTIGDGAASVDYPSLTCGGLMTQISRDDSSAEYRENITYGQGQCIDGGKVTIRLANGTLTWTWVGEADGQPYNAEAELSRK